MKKWNAAEIKELDLNKTESLFDDLIGIIIGGFGGFGGFGGYGRPGRNGRKTPGTTPTVNPVEEIINNSPVNDLVESDS